MPFAAFLISKIQFKCPWVGQAARKSSRYFGWWGHTHRPAWEEYSQLRSSLRSLPRSASHSPGADEQPSAEWRRPVLVDQPSGDRAVEQAKEAQQPQLGSLKLGPAEWSLTGVGLAESKMHYHLMHGSDIGARRHPSQVKPSRRWLLGLGKQFGGSDAVT